MRTDTSSSLRSGPGSRVSLGPGLGPGPNPSPGPGPGPNYGGKDYYSSFADYYNDYSYYDDYKQVC